LLASLSPGAAEEVHHFHLDHLGSPRLITDGSGAKIAYHEYLPFGMEATQPYQDDERLKFTGHERDYLSFPGTSFDIDYMHARYYRGPRFLSVDPVTGDPRAPQSWNGYAYVRGNPVSFVDPWGLMQCEVVNGVVTCGDEIEVIGEDPWRDTIAAWEQWRDRYEHSWHTGDVGPNDPMVQMLGYVGACEPFVRRMVAYVELSLFFFTGGGAEMTEGVLQLGGRLLARRGAPVLLREAAKEGQRLARSGPIARSVGAMSRAERLARKLKMNVNSPTTRQVLNSLDDTVGSFIRQFRKGSITRELPSEVLGMTVEDALSYSTKVRKLLTNGRFVK
jgi:RHS repeat-associated protein